MAKFEVAYPHEQGQDMVIVVVDHTFGHKSNQEQNETCRSLQACATSAGLRGTVVPVWDAGVAGWGSLLRSLGSRSSVA